MSNLQNRTRAANGIERWLKDKGYKVNNKITADITSSFLKSKGLEYKEFNPRYKGNWTAIIWNANSVQEHFNEFTKFVIEKYEHIKE